jgi:hypothetical protein
MMKLTRLAEPKLLFGYNQSVEDPRDGLMLFSPLDEGMVHGVRAGVIGTRDGIKRYKTWVKSIQNPIFNRDNAGDPLRHHPFFPGFQTVFRVPWRPQPALEIAVPDGELEKHMFLDDRYKRVYETVSVYADRILRAAQQQDEQIDVWFVIVPENLWKKCRPMSTVEPQLRIEAGNRRNPKYAQRLQNEPSLFAEDNLAARPYHYEVNFHNQLKARLLEKKILTQIIRETTIAPNDFLNKFDRPLRQVDDPTAIAWNLSTAVFYKAGGRPWRISEIRDGVCYIGLAFKQDNLNPDERSACCAAQMFLDSGDGVVFKGAVGPWYSPGRGDYHLSRDAAKQLMGLAIDSYHQYTGQFPREVFIHGKVRFEQNEWLGFRDAISANTNLVGVRIRDEKNLKLFRKGNHPILRGMSYIRDDWTAYLWTKGYIPRLQTYPGWGVPRPLLVEICRGRADMATVLRDLMALTKLNYNACVFADGMPVTLKFADAVGEILTAGPVKDLPPLPFRHYI